MELTFRKSVRAFQSVPQTLNNIESILDLFKDPRSTITEVKTRIAYFDDDIQALKNISEILKSEIDSKIEKDVENIRKLNTQMKKTKSRISEIEIDIRKLYQDQNIIKQEYERAKNRLERAKQLLSAAEQKLKEAEKAQLGVFGASVPLMVAALFTTLIPVVGPILAVATSAAGTAMCVSSLTVMGKDVGKKKSVVKDAENEKSDSENRLSDLNQKIVSLQGKLENANSEEKQLKQMERAKARSISDMKGVQQTMFEFLYLFNVGFHDLTVVSGRSRLLHSHARIAYSLNPLKPLLVAFFESFATFSDTELFEILNHDGCVKKWQVKEIQRKLKELPNEDPLKLEYGGYDDLF